MNVARRLRASADVIFERENHVAARFYDKLFRSRPTRTNMQSEEFDWSNFPQLNFDAAFMLMAFAIESLLKGIAVAKGLVHFSAQELPKPLKNHDLCRLNELTAPRAEIARHILDTLTYMSEWRARYPIPTSVEKFWPMHSDGTMKGGSYSWP